MQICDRYSQSSASRVLLKQNGRRSQRTENRRKEGRILCSLPPPPPPLLNFLGEKPPLRHTNGYSIAEILLVFGIIAGVLIGVWAMYTMLSDEADAQALVRDIQMLQEAAVQFKSAGGTNTYEHIYEGSYTYLDEALKPYLGQSSLADGVHVFGGDIDVSTWTLNDGDLGVQLFDIPNIDLCVRALSHFGTVTEGDDYGLYYIDAGDTIRGFVGGGWVENMGCEWDTYLDYTDMYIRID